MPLLKKIWRSNFLIRLRSWEYWPFFIVYMPVFIYWIVLSIRAKSLFYFSAANPSIENGGMLGESKSKIFDLIPAHLKPASALIDNCLPVKKLVDTMQRSFKYPVICKPDIGERGWKVEKINNEIALKKYHESMKSPYLIQEYLTEKIEMGIFYYRCPSKNTGTISSIVIKGMLTIVGDGSSTIKSLILANDRAKLQWPILKERYKDRLHMVLQNGEAIELVSIGNHSRGTKFLDGSYLINDQLTQIFDRICSEIKGFYFGRFDIKVDSVEDLYDGKIKIMELNGAGSEPAHIYDPKVSLKSAYESIFHHWRVLYYISVSNHKKGIPYLTLSQAWKEYKKIKALKN